LIIISLGIVFVLWWWCSGYFARADKKLVFINEVCDNNFSTIPLLWHEDDDWIELYNGTGKAVSLEGWTISDDESDLQRYTFPQLTLGAGEYLLLFANGEDTVTEDGIFLNFKVSQGENIYLCDADGLVVDSVAVPELETNTSYARIPDGSVSWSEVYPTLRASNDISVPVQKKEVTAPVFSKEGGFYNGSTMLELSVTEEDTNIYYTLDGSIPTQESMWYVEPLLIENRSSEPNNLSARTGISNSKWYQYVPEGPVDKITVVRAVAIDKDGNRSDVVTHSYFVDIQDTSAYQNLAMVSLTTDPDYFFNEETGLYVMGKEYEKLLTQAEGDPEKVSIQPNYEQSGKCSERDASIEIYDANRNVLLKQNVGVRIHGNSTRNMSQKSFSIYARELYDGSTVFKSDVFRQENNYHKFMLVTDYDETKTKQQLHAKLLEDRAVDTQKFIRANVFLNGEYWGVYWIAEVYNEEFVENYYGIPKEEVLIEDSAWPQELLEIVENKEQLSDEELYSKMIEKIDLQSCMDYYAAMVYIDHLDWFMQNTYMWKSITVSEDNPYQDGKWRWMVYDTDACENSYDSNTFQEGISLSWQEDPIINTLMLSEDFRRQFVDNFIEMADTVFEEEHVRKVIDEVFGEYANAMDAQAARWSDDWSGDMYEKADDIKYFYENRRDFIIPCLKKEFGY